MSEGPRNELFEALIEATNRVLPKHGMTLAESQVLATVSYGIEFPADRLAKHTHGLADGNPCGWYHPEEYMTAIASCMDKGWLVEAHIAPRRPGGEGKTVIAFTESGEKVFLQVDQEILALVNPKDYGL